jgi:serine/threonine protein kinase
VTVERLMARGDAANVYAVHYRPRDTIDAQRAVWKVARHPRHNDLLEAEANALRRLASHGDRRFAAYAPTLLDSFTTEQAATGMRRRTTVLGRLGGFVSLAQLVAANPGGVDARAAAWMWRRLLVALGHAHRAGIVHGAVVPEHVLIHPEEHGLVLIDWCYAVDTATTSGARITALVTARQDLYPPEVTNRQAATPATDIFMASQVMALLMRGRTPRPMRSLIAGCTGASAPARPQDAWALQQELDELLTLMYGPRRFRPFHVPADMPRTGRPAPTTPTGATRDPGAPHTQED